MKKKFTMLIAALALLTMTFQPLRMLGQTRDSYSYTFTAKVFNDNNQTKTLNEVDWTFAGTSASGVYFNYDGTKGQQFGSGSKPFSAFTLSTSGISGTITEIKVNTSGANSIAGTLNVTVGGNAFGDEYTLTNSATEVTFTGSGTGEIAFNYAQTSSKAIYIKSISVTYTTGGGTTPSISANNVNIAYDATSGSIPYTISNPTSATLSASCTADWVSNIAVTSSAVTFNTTANTANTERTATFTLTYTGATDKTVTVTQAGAPYTSIADIFAAATSTQTNVSVTFNNWVVSGVSTNGKNIFVTDNNGNGLIVFYNSNMSGTFAAGKVLSGTAVPCALKLYNGSAELLNVNTSDLTITDGGTITAANIAMASLTGVNTGALVHYDNLTCSIANSKYYLGNGTDSLQVYNSLFAFDALESGKTYNITGVYQQFNAVKEILPRSAADIVEVVATPTLTVSATSLTGFTYTETNGPSAAQSFTVSGSNLTADVTVTAPTNFEVCDTENGTYSSSMTITASGTLAATTVYVRMAAGLSVNTYSGNLSVASTGATSQTVALSGEVTAMPVVETPTFAPAGGTYTEAQNVTIACATDGATIYYTLDGTDPTTSSLVYTTAIAISATKTVKAMAVKSGMANSDIASATYTIVTPAQETTYTLITNANALVVGEKYIIVGIKGESYKALGKQNTNNRAGVDVTTSSNTITVTPATFATDDAPFELTLGQVNGHWTLYDAVNGGYLYAASSSSNYLKNQATNDANGEWTIEIATNGVATIKAQGSNTRNWLRLNNSGTPFSCYTSGQLDVYLYKSGDIPTVPVPQLAASVYQLNSFNYVNGSGPSTAQSFTLSGSNLVDIVSVVATDNFEICLTPDGTYTDSIAIAPTAMGVLSDTAIYVKMKAGLDEGSYTGSITMSSTTASANVALSGTVSAMPIVATPTFSLAAGTFLTPQNVSISCATEGATIYYTTNGSNPTTSSSVYSSALTISNTTTLKAMAAKSGHQNSAIDSVTYTIRTPMDIADARALANNQYACVEGTVTFITGTNVYIQDATAGIDLYLNSNTVPTALAVGDNVKAYGKKTVYKGLVELNGINGGDENQFVITSNGNTLPLADATIAEINADFDSLNMLQSTRVQIDSAIIGAINNNGTTIITQNGANLNVYNIPVVQGMVQGDYVSLVGVVSCYNTPQLLVASASDIQYAHRPTITATPSTVTGLTYAYEDGGPSNIGSFLLAGGHLHGAVDVYPSEHFEVSTFPDSLFHPETPASVYAYTGNFFDIPIYVRMVDSLPNGTYTEQLTLVSLDADTAYVTVTGTVTGGTQPTPPTPGSGDYVRISSLSELTNGSQVIIAARHDAVATSYYAMSNTSSGKPTGVLFTSTTSGSDEILPASIVDEESNYYWTVGVSGTNYTFTNASNELIGYTSSTNFTTGGDNTAWSIELSTAGDEAMVPNYSGFVITNVNNDVRHFALNSNHNFGPYHSNNLNNNGYNFYLDLFVKGEGGTPTTPVVATPTFTPEAGTYFEAQTVTIACATDSATIYYTLNGTDPDSTSLVYTSPFTIDETTTVKAIAMKAGYDNSAIATATYTIQLGFATIFNQDWEGAMNGWTFVSVTGDEVWNISQTSGNHYAKMSGYSGGSAHANEDWCISPAFNLNEYSNAVLTFKTAKNYDGPALQVFFSNDYNGTTPATATWTALTSNLSTGSWNWVESGDISLNSYNGTNCYIGFKYVSDTTAATWEVDDIVLIGQTSNPIVNVTPTSLTGFTYVVDNGPSTQQSFSVSAINLTANLTVTAATDFEISTVAGTGFTAQNTITLTPVNGAIDTIIYVRLKAGLAEGTYTNENIVVASTGVTSVNVVCSGQVTGNQPPVPTGDYVRIADLSEIVEGSQVVFAARYDNVANSYYAMSNTSSGKPEGVLFTSTTSGGNEILPTSIVDNEDNYYWTVTKNGEIYSFTNASNELIGYTSSTNFATGGDNTGWDIVFAVAGDAAMVPNYSGFYITNHNVPGRGFALNSNHNYGAYAVSNNNASGYNFYLDIFVKGSGGGTPTVAAPTFTPAAGTYYETQTVTLNCATPEATIYYSTTSETGPWTEYTDAITVAESMTIWAYAEKDDYNDSPVVSAVYVINTGLTIIFNQDWEGDWNGWTEVSVEGDSLWRINSYGGNHYAYANGYNHDASIDWLISPAFDLNSYTDVVLTFLTAKNYTGPDLEVYFSNDYDGQNPVAATWQALTCALSQGSWNWVESGAISLDGLSGTSCYIGFKYTSTDTEAAGWEVDDIMLISGGGFPSITATPNALADFEYQFGHGPSESQTYILTSANLEGQGTVSVSVTEPFQISLDDVAFSSSLTLQFANGVITNQPLTVYVRMAAGLETGTYTGTITHTGGGASATVSLTGLVYGEGDDALMLSVMPLYIQGNNGTNNNRVPVAVAAYITGLTPNTTYRYTNQFVDGNDGPDTAGAGNVIYANANGFYRTTSPSLATEGGYGEFTTEADGGATVWFINESTANSRFTPGNHVFLRVRINDGNNGTAVDQTFTSEDYATVLNFGNGRDAYEGTAFITKSDETAMGFAVMMTSSNDLRPVYMTTIESTGVDYSSISQYADFYKDQVAGNDGWFGGILPNDLSEGINFIGISDLAGTVVNEYSTTNGYWQPDGNTVNPNGGLDTPIFIDLTYDGIEETEANVNIWNTEHEFVIENGDNSHYIMTVYNILGQPMIQKQINAGSTQRISHSLASGIYIINLQNNQNKVSAKVIVR